MGRCARDLEPSAHTHVSPKIDNCYSSGVLLGTTSGGEREANHCLMRFGPALRGRGGCRTRSRLDITRNCECVPLALESPTRAWGDARSRSQVGDVVACSGRGRRVGKPFGRQPQSPSAEPSRIPTHSMHPCSVMGAVFGQLAPLGWVLCTLAMLVIYVCVRKPHWEYVVAGHTLGA